MLLPEPRTKAGALCCAARDDDLRELIGVLRDHIDVGRAADAEGRVSGKGLVLTDGGYRRQSTDEWSDKLGAASCLSPLLLVAVAPPLERLEHHRADRVHVTGANREEDVAGPEDVERDIDGLIEVGGETRARLLDHLRELVRVHARRLRLTGGVCREYDQLVQPAEARAEALQQVLRPGIGVWLKEGDDAAFGESLARGGDRIGDLRRVMRIVIHHRYAGSLADEPESSRRAAILAAACAASLRLTGPRRVRQRSLPARWRRHVGWREQSRTARTPAPLRTTAKVWPPCGRRSMSFAVQSASRSSA